MDQTCCIRGGTVVLADRLLENGSVLVKDGRIAYVGPGCPTCDRVIPAEGRYILPGFIDIHVHGGGGADFMDGTAEAIRTAAAAHCRHGTTALLPTTLTCPDELLTAFIDQYLRVKREGTGSAQLLGMHLEGPFFAAASKGAQPVGALRVPEEAYLERILALGQGEIVRWDAAPELPNMRMFADTMCRHGVLASVAHTAAVAEEAEHAFAWGFTHITHFYNAITTFRKVNGVVYSGVVEAAYLNDTVTLELIGDGCHIPRQSMLLAHRIKGADGIALITDAMRAAGTQATHSILGPLAAGVPVVIKDGVAQLTDLTSYAGSIATMDHVLRVAHLRYGLPLTDVSRMLSLTPARLCGVQARKGSLAAGKDADIVVMSHDFQVENVFVCGQACPV